MENQHYKSYEQAALDILRGKQPDEEVEEQEQVEEAAVHPDALHVKPVKIDGQTKYKVHAVGSNFSSGIKPGEHLSDSELDDFSEMGGRIKHMKEQVKPEVEKAFPATGVKKNPPMKGVSTMPKPTSGMSDRLRQGKLNNPMMKSMTREEVELQESQVHKIVKQKDGTYDVHVKTEFGETKHIGTIHPPVRPHLDSAYSAKYKDGSKVAVGKNIEDLAKKLSGYHGKTIREESEELDEVIRNDPLLMKVGPIVSRDNTTGRSSPEEQQQGKENVKRAVKASIARMKTDRKPKLPEQVEEIEEMGPGKLPRIDKKVENEYGEKLMKDFLAKGGEVKQVKSPALPKNRNRMIARGSLSSGERTMTRSGGKSYTSRMEEVEEDYDQLIEEKNAFEIELPEQLIFADYLNAAKMYAESYNDAVIIADHFFASNDEGLVIEAFMRSDIEDRVKMHQKAGNETTMPKYSTKDGKPHAEYIVTDKDSGKKTKYIHHGTMRRVERMN